MRKVLLVLLASLASYCIAQPTISSFTPLSGIVGSTVTITGTNFNSTTTNNIVFFGATKAIVNTASTTSLTVSVPIGATHNTISVLNITTGLSVNSTKLFLPTYSPNKSAAAVPIIADDFWSQANLSTNSGPTSVTMQDIDGDGKPDIITSNQASDNISIFRNTSVTAALSFDPKIDYATGLEPKYVAFGDLDGDGKPDMAISNRKTTSTIVSIYRNTSTSGNISFAARQDFTTGTQPTQVLIADLDNDGKPEVVTVDQLSNQLSVFRNTSTSGNISLATRVTYGTGSIPTSAIIADIDGDGLPDLSVSNYNTNSLYVFRNTNTISGTLSFANAVTFATRSNAGYLNYTDYDGDGKLDLVLNASVNTYLSFFRNTSTSGSLSFATRYDHSLGLGYSAGATAIGDIDGDGKPDITVPNGTNGEIRIIRNTATSGTIGSGSLNEILTLSAGSGTVGSFAGDIDADGITDIIATNYNSNNLSVYRNYQAFVWNGGGGDNKWATNANWQETTKPATGNYLVFDGSIQLANANNYIDGTVFSGIKFRSTAGSFVFTESSAPNSIILSGDINNLSANLQTLNIPLVLDAPRVIASSDGPISIGGVISGPYSLTKSGFNTVTLSATNTYSGGTNLVLGTLSVMSTNPNVLGSGTLTIANGTTLKPDGSLAVVTLTNAIALTSGTVTIPVQFTGGTDLTLSGVISGSGGINITSDINGRWLRLSGENTFSGGVLLDGTGATRPNIRINNVYSLGTGPLTSTVTVPEGRITSDADLSSGVANNMIVSGETHQLNIFSNGTSHLLLSGIISGAGKLVKTGTATLTLTGANTFTGLTTVSEGTLQLNRTGGLTIPATNSITIDGTGNLRVSSDQTVNNLTLTSGTLTIDAGVTLTITGAYTAPASLGTINNLGTIVLQGLTAQTFPGINTTINNGVLNQMTNLTINNANGVTLDKRVDIIGTFTVTSGTVISNGKLYISANATNTGRIGNSAGSITGNVTVKFYIPGGRRAFRLFGSPFSNNYDLSVLKSSIHITGTGGSSNGFDSSGSNNPSAFKFSESSYTGGTTGWTAYTNTTQSVLPKAGIRILYRGPRNQSGLLDGSYPVPNENIITLVRLVNMGTVVIPMTYTSANGANAGWNLIPNPYASNVDLGAIASGSRNNINSFSVWQPTGGTKGIYITNSFGSSYIIPAYSAFFVKTTSAANFTFTEADKTASAPSVALLKTDPLKQNALQIDVLSNDTIFWDQFVFRNRADGLDGKDNWDAPKMENPDVNFGSTIITEEKLAIDHRNLTAESVVNLSFNTSSPYHFTYKVSNFDMPGYDVYLKDYFTNKELKLSDNFTYNFETTTDANSFGDNRFKLLFKASSTSVETLGLTTNKFNLYPNPAANNITIEVNSLKAEKVTFAIIDQIGKVINTGNINFDNNRTQKINIDALTAGIYFIQLINEETTQTIKFVK